MKANDRPTVTVTRPDGTVLVTPFYASEHADTYEACALRLSKSGAYACVERTGARHTGYTQNDRQRMRRTTSADL